MRIVKIDGRDLKALRRLLGRLASDTDQELEVAVDTEGFKVRVAGMWTPGYGSPQPAQRQFDGPRLGLNPEEK